MHAVLSSLLHAWPFRQRSALTSRWMAWAIGVLLLVQLASFGVWRTSHESQVRATTSQQLVQGQRALVQLLAQQEGPLVRVAQRVGADGLVLHALQGNNASDLTGLLSHHAQLTGATTVALLESEPSGVRNSPLLVRAVSHPSVSTDRFWRDAASAQVKQLLAGEHVPATGHLTAVDGHIEHLVIQPLQGRSNFWVLVMAPVYPDLGQELKNLGAVNLSLLVRRDESSSWRLAMSNLPADLAALLPTSWVPRSGKGSQELLLGEQRLGAQTVRIEAPGSTAQVLAVLTLPLDAALRLPNDALWVFGFIALVGLAVTVASVAMLTGRMTQSLQNLTSATARLSQGDFSTPLAASPVAVAHDELGQLMQGFEQMRVQVARQQAQVRQVAYWDSLTGLPNRVQCLDSVRQAIHDAHQQAHAVALLVLDLERFKQLNETLGHHMGDLMLQAVAERLVQHIVRDGDLVARIGGSEFAVLLREGDASLAQVVAHRLSESFNIPLRLAASPSSRQTVADMEVCLGVHIGIACWPAHADQPQELLNRAEVALYHAKRQAGPRAAAALSTSSNKPHGAVTGHFQLYDPGMDVGNAHTVELLTELRRAIELGQLCLYLQPKLVVDGTSVIGAEALLRWQHPQHGLLLPEQFLGDAEETGLMRNLTAWVFEEAAQLWQLLHNDGMTLTMSVNLGASDLLDPELAQKFDALLVKHRAPAEGFCLEFNESALLRDPLQSHATLARLSALGFKLAIDDFGVGHSSLNTLKHLPIDELKIDRSFVTNMSADLDDARIVRSTIELAHNLGLSVVAEGVETAKALDMLREWNCDVAQGVHMGAPMPLHEFKAWCSAWVARQRPVSMVSSIMLH